MWIRHLTKLQGFWLIKGYIVCEKRIWCELQKCCACDYFLIYKIYSFCDRSIAMRAFKPPADLPELLLSFESFFCVTDFELADLDFFNLKRGRTLVSYSHGTALDLTEMQLLTDHFELHSFPLSKYPESHVWTIATVQRIDPVCIPQLYRFLEWICKRWVSS